MQTEHMKEIIESAWEVRDELSPKSGGEARQAVETALDALDSGGAVASRLARSTRSLWNQSGIPSA